MSKRFALAAVAASFALTACGSTGAGETSAQAPVQPTDSSNQVEVDFTEAEPAAEPWAPAPWTNAFSNSAVMLGHTFRIEGPVGLLEHVVASSDDAFYERSLETTPEGLLQVIRRVSPDVPEIRVQQDAWTLAAFDRVTILERVDCVPVRIVASGDALWRDTDGSIAQGQRIECTGEIGDDTLAVPVGAVKSVGSSAGSSDETSDVSVDASAVESAVESVESVEGSDLTATDVPEGTSASQDQ